MKTVVHEEEEKFIKSGNFSRISGNFSQGYEFFSRLYKILQCVFKAFLNEKNKFLFPESFPEFLEMLLRANEIFLDDLKYEQLYCLESFP